MASVTVTSHCLYDIRLWKLWTHKLMQTLPYNSLSHDCSKQNLRKLCQHGIAKSLLPSASVYSAYCTTHILHTTNMVIYLSRLNWHPRSLLQLINLLPDLRQLGPDSLEVLQFLLRHHHSLLARAHVACKHVHSQSITCVNGTRVHSSKAASQKFCRVMQCDQTNESEKRWA